jgi:hypothetical protein
MKLPSRVLVLLTAILFVGVLAAKAQEVEFSLTGPVDATAVVFTDPAAEITSSDLGFGFAMTPISLTVGGVSLPVNNLPTSYSLMFYNASPMTGGGGGFAALTNDGNTDAFSTFGPQLYTGAENAPSFASLIGETITLGDFDTDTADVYTLKVTAVSSVSTPEPATLLLLALALLPLGLLAKRLL